jgi:hypothetical protein
MAIVHVAMKSSSSAPPSAAHADYIMRVGQYKYREDVVYKEPGNMPEFAQADPRAFWQAADTHERANGRAYTELQIALPRELRDKQRIELAQEAAREFMGDRFAYILAVHNPVAKDNIEQPHMHIMFSERIVDERTRALPEEQFFKRNGAKKDREWNDRAKPEEIRVKWCEMMNRAMEREGIEERVDPRSWKAQGREDLAALREEKELHGDELDAVERRKEIAQLRELRKGLPAPGLAKLADLQQLEAEAAAQIAAIERRLEEETGILDKLIAKAREAVGQVVEWGQNLLAGPSVPVFARMSRAMPPDLERSGAPPPAQTPAPSPAAADAVEAKPKKHSAEEEREALAYWRSQTGNEIIALNERNVDGLAEAEKDQRDHDALEKYIQTHEKGQKLWQKALFDDPLKSHREQLAVYKEYEAERTKNIAYLRQKIEAHERTREKTIEQFYGQKADKEAAAMEPVAIRLSEKQVQRLLAAEYPNDIRAQVTARQRMTVEGESVEIMGGRVDIDYDAKGKFYYATLQQGDRAELEQHIDRITPREKAPEPQRQQQREAPSQDIERD